MAAKSAATVSGPGVDRAFPAGPAVALSGAITIAGHLHDAATLYVRDERGEPYGRVERDEQGLIYVYRTAQVAR